MNKFYHKLIFLFALVTYGITADAQKSLTTEQMDSVALLSQQATFARAEAYLLDENYDKALPLYDTLLLKNPNNGSWNFKIGLCYLNSAAEFSKSVYYFEQAAQNFAPNTNDLSFKEDKAPTVVFMYLGDAYQRNYRFNEAIEAYRKFRTFVEPKNATLLSLVDHKIQVCKNGVELTASPVNMYIKNLGVNINSPYPDYAPVLSADESILLFTSRRPGSTGGKLDEEGKYYEDIYMAFRSEDEMNWEAAKNIGSPINTSEHEATISTSIDGQILFIYKDDEDSGSIYITNMQGEDWTVPEKVSGDVNSKYWETHATLSDDGTTLYFVSNRPGGFGGRDIYRCKKLPSGQWSKAMNLGPNINTPYEEDSPFIQPGTGALYFSSEGHKSMGGFDIFVSNYVDTGLFGGWEEPENMGYPVNTTGDDLFFVPTMDKKRAYYSSAMQGGQGDNDIYLLIFPEKEESMLTVMRGNVIDDVGGIPENVMIEITDATTGDKVGSYSPNAKTGRYIFILPHSKTYKITYVAEGFHPVERVQKVEPGKEYLETEMVLILKEVRLERQQLGTIGVYGEVLDPKRKPVRDVTITVFNNDNGKSEGTFQTDNKGQYQFVLDRGRNYNISYEASGFLMQSENVDTPKEKVYSSVEKNVTMQPIAEGSTFILKNLFFDTNKSKIKKDSRVELGKLIDFMKANESISIEVSGHTDNTGKEDWNKKLSADRAKSVKDYLIKNGIRADRIAHAGYGADKPIATNDTEAGKQENRRVEIKILSK